MKLLANHRPAAFGATLFATLSLALFACNQGTIETGEDLGSDLEPGDDYEAAPAVLPRLTSSQYRNSLVDLLGADLPETATPADTNPYLFYSIGATSTVLSELGTQTYADSASTIASWLFEETTRWQNLVGCAPSSIDDECVGDFFHRFGKRLFRRPLTEGEVAEWQSVARDTARGSVDRGLRIAVYGMLQSPQFLYRVEVGEPDPASPKTYRYTNYEMAQRLSFLFWNTAPDEELMAAAERGELVTDEGVYQQASRLLDSERTRVAVQDFFAQYFDLGKLDELDRDLERFPAFSHTLREGMKTEVKLLVDDLIFRRDADIRQIYSTRTTYVNSELAALYGVDAPGASAVAYVPVELPADGPRGGVLTSAALLSMNAHQTETSPTLRGKFLRERVLCELVPPPPGNADFEISEPDENARTLRERLEQHRSDPVCAGCHTLMDPLGFLFEGFDSIGAVRELDNGVPVDTTGDLDGEFLADARDLADVLGKDPRVSRCLVKQLYRHANGRLDTDGEALVIDEIDQRFGDSGYRFQDLLLELALSPGFRKIAPAEVSQ